MPDHLIVIAKIVPKPEYFGDAKSAIQGIVSHTLKEDGCVVFSLFENKDGASLHLYEEWKSEADLAAHYQREYTKSVFASYENWLKEPVQVEKLKKVA